MILIMIVIIYNSNLECTDNVLGLFCDLRVAAQCPEVLHGVHSSSLETYCVAPVLTELVL